MASNSQNYTLGRGRVHFARFKDGTQEPGPFRYIGNSPEFNLTIESEDLDHQNSDDGIREIDCSIVLEVTRTGSMTTDNIDRENLALFFFGEATTLTQAPAVGLTETVTGAILGQQFKLGLSPTTPAGVMGLENFVVQDSTNTTTFVEGTDYTVNLDLGMLTVLDGGGIAAGDDLNLTYDLRGSTRDRIVSGNQAVEGALMYESRNPTGQRINYYMPYVKVTPNGDFALKSDEWQTIPFTLDILTLTDSAAIYADGEIAYA